jgi:hypothetical protein
LGLFFNYDINTAGREGVLALIVYSQPAVNNIIPVGLCGPKISF